MVGRCYNVDMCSQKSLSKEGKWPGVALPAREIHFRDWKSILRLPNHCQLWPTPRFYCKGGEEGVCSYWILTGNTEAAAPERPMQSGEVVKHECKFCTSLVKCKTQMQRKPTIYSRHVQSKKMTNYNFGKGYFGFSWNFHVGRFVVIQKVWCLFICVIIPTRPFFIRKRSQISGGHLPKLFCDSFPTKNQQTDMHKKWVVLSLSSQKAKRSGRLTSDMSKGQFLPQRSRAGVMAFHPSCWS